MTTGPAREPQYCPRCGAAYEPLQEYCLECGERLPTSRGLVGFLGAAWQRRLPWYPGDWVWPALLFLAVAAIATAAAVAAGSRSSSRTTLVAVEPSVTVGPGASEVAVPTERSPRTLPTAPRPTITTGPLPAAPGAPRTKTGGVGAPLPGGLVAWPAGTAGYTDLLEALPLSSGRAAAVARAKAAKARGLPDVGVLLSSAYSSLHPGYYVIFSGIYGTPAQAAAGLTAAHAHGFPAAYQARVTR